MALSKFSDKTPSESVKFSFDFTNLLTDTIEAILSATWAVSVVTGVDVTPSAMLAGTESHTRTTASHLISGGVNGNTYLISCTVVTSYSQTLVLSGLVDVTTSLSTVSLSKRQDLADFCLRQLGGGVVNVEVSDDQVSDAIELAIEYYHEMHPDGIERDYMVHKLTGTVITVADPSLFAAGNTIATVETIPPGSPKTRAQIVSIQGNQLTINAQIGYDKFALNQQVMSLGFGNPNTYTTITGITLGDMDNKYITLDDGIVGITRILNVTNVLTSVNFMFNVNYQIMMSEIQNLTKNGTAYLYGFQQYLSHLDFIMKKEKNFSFNRRMHRLFLEIEWNLDVAVNDIVVAEVYRIVDPEIFSDVFNDRWLKKYATALIKKQLGTNTKKYGNVQLPGGLTYTGQQIFDEAVQEIKDLEEESLTKTAPLGFMWG